jgi:hypothetical protein
VSEGANAYQQAPDIEKVTQPLKDAVKAASEALPERAKKDADFAKAVVTKTASNLTPERQNRS